MDVIEKDPTQAYPEVKPGDDVIFKTGDEFFDTLEERVAKNEEIKLEDFVDAAEAEDVRKRFARAKQKTGLFIEQEPSVPPEDTEFSDDYGNTNRR